MKEEIIVDPITRIEGHARLTIEVSGDAIEGVRLNVVEAPRFFEKLMEGKLGEEAPRIAERLCGICFVAHGLASAKAIEMAWAAEPPPTAILLRKLIHAGGIISSHGVHLTFLALPDLLGLEERSVFGLRKAHPEILERAMSLHALGLKVTSLVGGRGVHPPAIVLGGMSKPLKEEEREVLSEMCERALDDTIQLTDLQIDLLGEREDLFEGFPQAETHYMALTDSGRYETYEGSLKVTSPSGSVVVEFEPKEYSEHIAERSVPHSYAKYPYLRALGYPEGAYRVGPLARLNISEDMVTPKASEYAKKFYEIFGTPSHSPIAYNLARAVEIVGAIERAKQILSEKRVTGEDTLSPVEPGKGEGVGVIEAPRGVLIHHYKTDKNGAISKANLIVATQQNVPLMERDLKMLSHSLLPLILSPDRKKAILKLETLIRAYDPCLSCATHLVEIKDLPSWSSRTQSIA